MRILKLNVALERLRRGENVQNRQLRTLLGEQGFLSFLDDRSQQQLLRKALSEKPREIVAYEHSLRDATFAYCKADAASRQGRHSVARKLSSLADAQFGSLAEFLVEKIVGHAELEAWLDRAVHYDPRNAPSYSPDGFPCVVTSRSVRNEGGGLTSVKRTKMQLKIEAVERAIEEVTLVDLDEASLARRLAAGRRLVRLTSE